MKEILTDTIQGEDRSYKMNYNQIHQVGTTSRNLKHLHYLFQCNVDPKDTVHVMAVY